MAPRRGIVAGPLVAAVTLVAALVLTGTLSASPSAIPTTSPRSTCCWSASASRGLVGLDILLRARALSQRFPPSRAAIRASAASAGRGTAAWSRAARWRGFYVTYMAYRNLKAIVPLVRPHAHFDGQLADLDRMLFGGGTDPSILLHRLLGEGIPTHILSTAYVAFIVFLPLTIGLALVFSRDLQAGLLYTTAQSVNWVLGAASYFLLPSLGPVYADPAPFAALPYSEVTRLQGVLLDQRVAFLAHPAPRRRRASPRSPRCTSR